VVALAALLAASPWIPVAAAGSSAAVTTPVRPAAAGTATLTSPITGGVPASVSRTDQVIVRWAGPRATAQGATIAADGPTAATGIARLATVRAAAAAAQDAIFVRSPAPGTSIYRLAAPLGQDAPRFLAALRQMPGVTSVEPDLWITPDALPNDPFAGQLWGLLGPADGSLFGIDARAAWPTTTGTGVTVGVIDTGLLFGHPDLAGQAWPGYDLISSAQISRDGTGRDADASDPGDTCNGEASSWHGTHVAGTIAAIANNAIGVFGGAPGVKIEPVRAIGTCGGYESDVADAIEWASGGSVPGVPANPHPARVLNLSLSAVDTTCPPFFATAIADARSRGAVVVVAAGNDGEDAGLSTPANCSEAITVAAIDSSGRRPGFSNYGSQVDLAGPGVGIISAIDTGATNPVGPTYAAYSGTSMATPHVALSAALVAAAYPGLSPRAIEFVLETTATAVGADPSSAGCPTVGCGAGIVNAGRAIAALAGPAPVVGQVTSAIRYPKPSTLFTVTAFAVDGSGVASAQWQLDGGAWTTMSAADGSFGGTGEPLSATLIAPATEGSHVVCVRATDTTANTSDGTACTPIVVDAGPPAISTPVLSPTSTAQGAPVTLSSTATDGLAVVSAQMRLDGGAWLPIAAADGAFDSAAEALSGTINEVVPGSHTVCIRAIDGVANTSDGTACATFTVHDITPPVATAPLQAILAGATIGTSTVPVRLSWTGSDPYGSVARYEFARSTNDGPFKSIALTTRTATTSTRSLAPGTSRYRFRVRAIDAAGNVGEWQYGPAFQVRLLQDTSAVLRYAGGWVKSHASTASGGHLRSTTMRNASVRTTFSGRAVAWVAPRGPTRGSARIYIDGALVRTVSLRSGSTSARRIVFSMSWDSPGSHTIKIVCQATAGHRRIDMDTIVVLH